MTDSLFRFIQARSIVAAETGLIPDGMLRMAIRRLCANRAAAERGHGRTSTAFAKEMMQRAVATHTQRANTQHYEVSSALFRAVLGRSMKYSACIFPSADATLDTAESATLALTCERAELEDGMRVLDLGCGWGSLTSYISEHYPRCQVTAVSNSTTQRSWIQEACKKPGWGTVDVVTADAANFELGKARFDRILSIEMFEHMRNWHVLFNRIAAALTSDGAFFLHVFCHRAHPYFFEDEGELDWMTRHFFAGGIMPSFDLPQCIPSPLSVETTWQLNGREYGRTLRCWLERLDRRRADVEGILREHLDTRAAGRAVQRWRMFFMACEELFNFDNGREWFVVQYRLRAEGHS